LSVVGSTMETSKLASIRDALESDGETLYEELASALIHVVGAVMAAAALALLVVLASFTGSAKAVATCAIYGAAVILTFLFSAMYHGIWHRTTKAVFLLLDHCSIFVLIAGTYTPVVLLALPPALGWTLFGVLWGLAVLGIAVRLWFGHLHWVLIPIFVAMGWLGLVWGDTLFTHLGNGGGWLLLSGGFAYTGGLIFFVWRRLPFNHALWHLCVLGGAVCHFLLVALYALPETP